MYILVNFKVKGYYPCFSSFFTQKEKVPEWSNALFVMLSMWGWIQSGIYSSRCSLLSPPTSLYGVSEYL